MSKIINSVVYTVRVDMRRVIAWAVVREYETNHILMEPITLSTDPREQWMESVYIPVTEDDNGNETIKPQDVINVIPATATSQAWFVLQADGKDCHDPRGGKRGRRIEHPAGFHTAGTDYSEWLEEGRMELEENCEQQFDWYFRALETTDEA